MRSETVLHICQVLHITPNEILAEEPPASAVRQERLLKYLNACFEKDKNTALQLPEVI